MASRFRKDESGATAIEYGLMVSLIAAVLVVVVGNLGLAAQGEFSTVCTALGGTDCLTAPTSGG
ncbi:MAG: Flp family type IVb pilin [Rhodobacteraceae bacterium]|nr:Flp family type IVb pilin [Paracoccaceae bacterium]